MSVTFAILRNASETKESISPKEKKSDHYCIRKPTLPEPKITPHRVQQGCLDASAPHRKPPSWQVPRALLTAFVIRRVSIYIPSNHSGGSSALASIEAINRRACVPEQIIGD
ncbi:hypothetical protein PHSY_000195 [Pseudozyma hubeiensis SY62]|uniref:Uncharacterized protein n=1 Tax=Pseudozyma hubeiensis (strain SY62) TaxID=1305764 RepID=R9NW13_PSEHS|nr:hypothetical protein PHSY_000195 [Pseudozyma hubeiensis SY62]GAC92641.1 hypothetical protein PHSY_000195 [Pseudozyma hubeiensis SY62]